MWKVMTTCVMNWSEEEHDNSFFSQEWHFQRELGGDGGCRRLQSLIYFPHVLLMFGCEEADRSGSSSACWCLQRSSGDRWMDGGAMTTCVACGHHCVGEFDRELGLFGFWSMTTMPVCHQSYVVVHRIWFPASNRSLGCI
jgi:hypothetical protein